MSDFAVISPDQLPLNKRVRVLASNEDGLVALEKPSGAMSHPNSPKDNKRSLLVADYDLEQECYTWTDESGETRQAWLINRLDSPTSGVILLGLNVELATTIKRGFSTHHVTKIYYALVRGKPSAPVGSWSDRLKKDVHSGKRRISKAKLVSAKTRYQAIKSPTGGFPITLMKLVPLTGRTHQLRVQCKKHGVPIVGDRTYGSFSFNKEVTMLTARKRMMLHSSETTLRYSFKGKLRTFSAESELPEDFHAVMAYRPGLNMNLEPKPSLNTKHNSDAKPSADAQPNSVLEGRRFKA